jgi:hypothetical protein
MGQLAAPGPSLAELSSRAAVSWYMPQLARPGLSRLLRAMRWWG